MAREIDVREAAEMLGVQPRRVRELIRNGRLVARHHPTAYRWLIESRSVRDYIRKGRCPGTGRPRNVDFEATAN